MASNNDCGIREYDMEKFQLMNHFRFPWPVNVSFSSTQHKNMPYNQYLPYFLYLQPFVFVNAAYFSEPRQ